MVLLGEKAANIENVCHVVGRREAPSARLIHQEREILVVIVCVIGQNIEYHAPENLFL